MPNSSKNLLKNVAGIAVILLVFVPILRAVLAPLYMEMAQMERMQNQSSASDSSTGDGGGNSDGGGSGENININLGGFGSWFNWALGWA